MGGIKVLHLTTSYPAHLDDRSGVFVRKLVDAQMEVGLKPMVITPAADPSSWRPPYPVFRFRYAPGRFQTLANRPGGLPVALKQRRWSYAMLPFFLGSFLFWTVRFAPNCDVVHAHWSGCGALAVLTKSLHHRPVVTTLRGSDHHKNTGKGLYPLLHRLATSASDAVTGVSEEIARSLQSARQASFIPNGVDDAFYRVAPNKRPPAPPFRLLFVGSLIPSKGVDILLKALAFVKDKDFFLQLAGDGPEYHRLEILAGGLGIREMIHFTGNIPPKEIPAIMSRSHLLVLPSLHEGRSNVILEAMASATPPLATDIPGTRELIQHGKTGFLFPPANPHALAGLLQGIMTGRYNLLKMGLAGRRWMRDQGLTWEYTARQYEMLYEEVKG